ncbi:hypothetical protein LSTR_LSTR014413 [Laodelphax striatellus]|uniref:MAGE domain-containing protein n=1 Tax=Laodelphax striatellus TaxID=195883 RepID=A0A482X409_LAOST|nr:hypothetical protein LSTR_LSTR014413 [Laodelphax striatellus]
MSQRRSQAGSMRSQQSGSTWSQRSCGSMRSQQSRATQESLFTQAQLESQTQSQSQAPDEEVLEEAAVELVNFFLDHQQFGVPMKRQTITKAVPKTQGRIFKRVINIAQKKLDDIFGMELIELPNKNNLRYILINKLKSDIPEINVALCNTNILKKNERSLLLLVLTVVYKSGGELKESTLLEFCRRANIIESEEKPIIITPYFVGIDFLKFLRSDLVDMLYLECKVLDQDGENEMRFYSWGLRAENEVDQNELEAYYQSIVNTNQ